MTEDNLDQALTFIHQGSDRAEMAMACALLDIAISLRRLADRGLWRPPGER